VHTKPDMLNSAISDATLKHKQIVIMTHQYRWRHRKIVWFNRSYTFCKTYCTCTTHNHADKILIQDTNWRW